MGRAVDRDSIYRAMKVTLENKAKLADELMSPTISVDDRVILLVRLKAGIGTIEEAVVRLIEELIPTPEEGRLH